MKIVLTPYPSQLCFKELRIKEKFRSVLDGRLNPTFDGMVVLRFHLHVLACALNAFSIDEEAMEAIITGEDEEAVMVASGLFSDLLPLEAAVDAIAEDVVSIPWICLHLGMSLSPSVVGCRKAFIREKNSW